MNWFNPAEILSYNCLLNFIVGNRGGGKTFNTLAHCVNAFIKNKDEFVYVRRTAEELKTCKDTLFKDLIANDIFPEHELSVKGNKCIIDGLEAGYCIPLSGNHHYRSVAMPKVKYVIYDEFLKRKDSKACYLKNEAEQFLELLETIARNRDNVRCLFLGNSMSKANPFFDYFKICPPNNSKFMRHPDKNISLVIQQYVNTEQIKAKENTKMGRTIKGTQYGNFNMGNEYYEDNYEFVEKMNGKAVYQCTLYYNGQKIAVYWQESKGIYHCNTAVNEGHPVKFAFTTEDHKPNIMLFKTAKNNPFIKRLMVAHDYSCVRYENLKIKNLVLDIIGYL